MDAEFTYPEDITALSDADLAAAADAAVAEFDRLRSIEDPTEEQVAAMEALADHVAAVRGEESSRVEAAAARKTRADAAAERISPPEDEANAESEDEPEDQAAEEAAEEETEVEQAEDHNDDQEDPVATERVAASGSLARRARRPANPTPRRTSSISLTAAADVPGFVMGSRLDDLTAVAQAFMSRSKAFPAVAPKGKAVRSQYGVATIERDFDGIVDTNPDFADGYVLAREAIRQSRLPGGSLIAAGGWCAPSETVYDLCQDESTAGIISLPEMGVTRGGIRFTSGPDFGDIFGNPDSWFHFTEAEVEGGVEKPCAEIECPEFEEVRMDVSGICIKAPLLTRAAYPELVRRWIEGTIVASAHHTAAAVIRKMQDLLGPAVDYPDAGAVGYSVLNAIELAAQGLRYRYRLSDATVLEVVAPEWLRAAIKADMRMRNGMTSNVTDAMVTEHFNGIGIAPQWVYNYQDLTTPGGTGSACVTAYPDTAEIMLYPAGTFVKGTQHVISLDTLYDTTDLKSNKYLATFIEDGWMVLATCAKGCRMNIPVCISGRTGAADLTACYGAAVTAPGQD